MRIAVFAAVILGLSCCVTLAQVGSTSEKAFKEGNAEPLFTKVYRMSDLPIYYPDGKPNITPLLDRIQLGISPESWEALGGDSTMSPFGPDPSVIVKTNKENHDAISKYLDSLRPVERPPIAEQKRVN